MPVVRVVAQVMDMNLNQARFDRAPNYSKIKDPAEDLREDRYYVEPHLDSGFWILDF